MQNAIGGKKGRLDVAYAANNNMNFNRLEFDNFNRMINSRQNDSERTANQDIEYSN